MKIFRNGLATGIVLQLAIGPVFFFIINLALQKSIFDGLIGTLAVTIVDYFYITLAIFGIGKLLENKKIKKVFGIISSIVLIIFGVFIIKGRTSSGISTAVTTNSTSLLSSFASVFFLTISSPMTIDFTGNFAPQNKRALQHCLLFLCGMVRFFTGSVTPKFYFYFIRLANVLHERADDPAAKVRIGRMIVIP